jgi:hypothetical protein
LNTDIDSLRSEGARQARILLARRRIESGYYLSHKVATATARKMLEAAQAPISPRASEPR